METILYGIIAACVCAAFAINLLLPYAYYRHLKRTEARSRFKTIRRLYGLHYQRRASLISDKR